MEIIYKKTYQDWLRSLCRSTSCRRGWHSSRQCRWS